MIERIANVAAVCAGLMLLACTTVAMASNSDYCREDSGCGYFVCHHTMCNCCPTVHSGSISWDCVQGACDRGLGEPNDPY